MCYKVDCKKCGKSSWGGCGKHLTAVYNSIEKGKHCLCRSWPGIAIPVEERVNVENKQQPPQVPHQQSTVSSASSTTPIGDA